MSRQICNHCGGTFEPETIKRVREFDYMGSKEAEFECPLCGETTSTLECRPEGEIEHA